MQPMRRILLFLLSPILLIVAAFSLLIGFSFYAGSNPATLLAIAADPATALAERVIYLLARLVLLPFQLVFIFLTFVGALWVFRRRERIGAWVLGEPVAERLTPIAGETLGALRPNRRRTLQQILASIIGVVGLIVALVLSLGQFIPRGELVVVITALTSSLTWGARLPIGDLLGGITNIFETNVSVGERIRYQQVNEKVEGVVEKTDLRFLAVRAESGELTTIPHGELRVFRNYSRGEQVGVYATFPIDSRDLGRAVTVLGDLAPESTAQVPLLTEPWQVMSADGRLGRVVDLSLYGRTTSGNEDDLQLALHALVRTRLDAAGIQLGGRTEATS